MFCLAEFSVTLFSVFLVHKLFRFFVFGCQLPVQSNDGKDSLNIPVTYGALQVLDCIVLYCL